MELKESRWSPTAFTAWNGKAVHTVFSEAHNQLYETLSVERKNGV